MSKLDYVFATLMAFVMLFIGHYVILNTDDAIIKYPDAVCCAPIQINWLVLAIVAFLAIIIAISLQHPYIRYMLLGGKHE